MRSVSISRICKNTSTSSSTTMISQSPALTMSTMARRNAAVAASAVPMIWVPSICTSACPCSARQAAASSGRYSSRVSM